MTNYDLIVIGAGPGGYVAAIAGAQKGMRVACIEKQPRLGGTCLNVGCIPSKALLHSSEYYQRIALDGKEHGIEAEQLFIDLSKMMERKNKIVTSLTDGIAYLFKKNKIDWIQKEAKLLKDHQVLVGDEKLSYKHLILATGSMPTELPHLPFDEKTILSSTGALALNRIPKKMLLVGAGIIGLELGSVYCRLGTEIEVVEMLDRPAPPFDKEISKELLKIFKKQGFTFHFNTKVIDGQKTKSGIELTTDSGKKLAAQSVLVAVGRRPYFENLGLEDVGVAINERNQVIIDGNFQTSIPNIYAIGDLVEGSMLAHKASEEGIVLVDYLAGNQTSINYLAIPNVMYTWPEVASVGMNEEQALAANLQIKVGKASLKANSRARCAGDSDGLIKIISDAKSDRLIGMHLLGANVSEMIGVGVVAIEKKMSVTELAHLPHAHPTISESIKEAALALHGKAIHF